MCLLFCNQCVCLCVWGQLEMPLCRRPCVFIVCLLFTKQRLRVCVCVCVCVYVCFSGAFFVHSCAGEFGVCCGYMFPCELVFPVVGLRVHVSVT